MLVLGRAVQLAALFLAGTSTVALGQSSRPTLGAQVIWLGTRASPALAGADYTEAYLTQPALMLHWAPAVNLLEFTGTVNLEGWTLRRGELNAGIWGEGYIDRRHPHTYLHEAAATLGRRWHRLGASLTVGRGFAPFGTDDPMRRPFAKYPANHHLAQILERLIVSAALRYGFAVLEAGVFNGDEPEAPGDVGTLARFGDSRSARVTLRHRSFELQASAAFVRSPEWQAGFGLDQSKRSLSLRHESSRVAGGDLYALLEWAATREELSGHGLHGYQTVLAEARYGRRALSAALRYERTERPEEERLIDPFRAARPHTDLSILGITRWEIVTANASGPLLRARGIRVQPLVELSRLSAVQRLRGFAFDPALFYGSQQMWSFSVGLRVEAGVQHRRMGRYGVARAVRHDPGHAQGSLD